MAEVAVTVVCPACDEVFELPVFELDIEASCPSCNTVWRVAKLKPLELSYALESNEESPFVRGTDAHPVRE